MIKFFIEPVAIAGSLTIPADAANIYFPHQHRRINELNLTRMVRGFVFDMRNGELTDHTTFYKLSMIIDALMINNQILRLYSLNMTDVNVEWIELTEYWQDNLRNLGQNPTIRVNQFIENLIYYENHLTQTTD